MDFIVSKIYNYLSVVQQKIQVGSKYLTLFSSFTGIVILL